MGNIRIGISGLMVPGKKQEYPPEFQNGSRLRFYGSLFNTIEINSTFHKLPLAGTLAKWTSEVPDHFRFTLKLWKEITHVKKLDFSRDKIDRFMELAQNIGNKKGCLLIQFPGSISAGYSEQVEAILEIVNEWNEDGGWKVSVEFRNASWYQNQTWNLLQTHNAGIVFHDLSVSSPPQNAYIRNPVYLRFHGPTGKYRDSYSEIFLNEQAIKIRKWLNNKMDVYVYFNNTMGDALANALYLKDMLIEN